MKKLQCLLIAILMCFTFTSCFKSEEVKNVESAISAMGEVELTSNDEISEVEALYNALPEEEKEDVENYTILEDKRTEFDNMLKGLSDETKFCARAMISVYNNSGVTNIEHETIGFVTIDDINYAVIMIKNNDNNENEIYIVTDDNVIILGKVFGVVDDETGFTTFENPDYISPDFIKKYDDNKIDPNEVLAIVFRYLETEDPELIDISGLEKQSKIATKADLDLVNALFIHFDELQDKYIKEMEAANFSVMDQTYYDTINTLEIIRKTDLSSFSNELEAAKQILVTDLIYCAYERMKVAEAYENLDIEALKIHAKKALEYQRDYEANAVIYANEVAKFY